MVKIEWTHEAEIWLRDIYNYIATDNRDAARRTVAGIFEKVQLLTKDTPTSLSSLGKFVSYFMVTIELLV